MFKNYSNKVQLVECPRDAMQGWPNLIPTRKKIAYLNALLKVGFHTLDCGSFVSSKAVPQMADSKEVIENLSLEATKTKLLVIVANARGAEDASRIDTITYLGFPFSISPTFQLRNTNSTIEESVNRVEDIQNVCIKNNKELVVYLSMAFGNPYGDAYSEETLLGWADEMVKRNIKIISLADTLGVATPDRINFTAGTLIQAYPQTTFGVHLHSDDINRLKKIQAAVEAGCNRFDGALKGVGGCPMAADKLVGNISTEWMISYFKELNVLGVINESALEEALVLANEIFI